MKSGMVNTEGASMSKKSLPKHERDNRANQLNQNNDAYWQSRGEPGKPDGTGSPAPKQPPEKPSR
jgi:hypothetical protein